MVRGRVAGGHETLGAIQCGNETRAGKPSLSVAPTMLLSMNSPKQEKNSLEFREGACLCCCPCLPSINSNYFSCCFWLDLFFLFFPTETTLSHLSDLSIFPEASYLLRPAPPCSPQGRIFHLKNCFWKCFILWRMSWIDSTRSNSVRLGVSGSTHTSFWMQEMLWSEHCRLCEDSR